MQNFPLHVLFSGSGAKENQVHGNRKKPDPWLYKDLSGPSLEDSFISVSPDWSLLFKREGPFCYHYFVPSYPRGKKLSAGGIFSLIATYLRGIVRSSLQRPCVVISFQLRYIHLSTTPEQALLINREKVWPSTKLILTIFNSESLWQGLKRGLCDFVALSGEFWESRYSGIAYILLIPLPPPQETSQGVLLKIFWMSSELWIHQPSFSRTYSSVRDALKGNIDKGDHNMRASLPLPTCRQIHSKLLWDYMTHFLFSRTNVRKQKP